MADREPIAWITRGGKHIPIFDKDELEKEKQIAKNRAQAKQASDHETHKPLESIEDEKELQDAMHKMFIEEGSYVNDPEYKKLQEELSESRNKESELSKRFLELSKIIKEESTVDKDILDEFGGDRNLANLFAKKSEKGKQAEEERRRIFQASKEIQDKIQSLQGKIKERDREESAKQKEAYKETTIDIAKKKEYSGFELDTHTSKYQDLYREGKARIFEMSPKKYLELCAYKIFPDSTYEKQVRVAIGDAKHTMDLVNLMRNGTKMYMPALDFKNKEQEGRHRAVAAMVLGIDKIPVMVVA